MTVVASRVGYLDGKLNAGPAQTDDDGIRIRYAAMLSSIHRSFFHRLLAFLSFMCSSVREGLRAGQVDVVIGTTPPLFQALAAWCVALLRWKPFILEVRDLWPDFAIEMGVLKNPFFIWLGRRLECFLYRRAKHIIVNSPAFIDYLVHTRGIRRDKITLVPNGVDVAMFDPAARGEEIRNSWGVGDRFCVVYAGALGPANDIPTIIRAAERLRADDEILVTQMEHHANLVPWFQLAERTNAKVRFLPIEADGTLSLDRLRAMLSERTRLIAFAAVSNVLGTRNDVAQIVRIAREAGVATLVDAAQHVPHDPTDVQAWGADFVAFSGHKMLGPTGVGVLWGRRELLDSIQPFLGGGNMIEEVTEQGFTTKASPARFEAGTPPIVEVIGLAAAVDYLSRWPMEAIARHEHRLTEVAMAGMSRIDGLRILGPAPDQRAGIVSFVVDGVSPHDLCKFLDLRGFALRDGHHCAMPLHRSLGIDHSARASFYLYNTVEEVERFVETLAATIEKLR